VDRERFERDGFVIVENALDAETTARLTAAADRVWAGERPDRSALHLLGFLGRDEAFVELVDHATTFPLVRELLGWNIYVYHCHLDVHPPLVEPPRWRWHQDGGRQNLELESPRPRLSVKVAYFLTDVTAPEQGALSVIPGSHTRDRLPTECEPEEAIPLLVRAGTAVVFDRRLWHARGDNTSTRTRKALFYGYTYRWVRPRDELGIPEAQIAGLEPVRRQLLGAGTSAIGYWIPTEEDVPLRAIG
jgi:ectoine hydroxylase